LETLKIIVYFIEVLFGSENWDCVLIEVYGLWELWRMVLSGQFGVWKKDVLVANWWRKVYNILQHLNCIQSRILLKVLNQKVCNGCSMGNR